MQSIRSLVTRLEADFPALHFVSGNDFHWSHEAATITYLFDGPPAELIHELAHATLEHTQYQRDVELLARERDAWTVTKNELGPRYNINILDEDIQRALDTYRDWLHARSTCPECKATGIEVHKHTYRCPACRSEWRVNEARVCALRRHILK